MSIHVARTGAWALVMLSFVCAIVAQPAAADPPTENAIAASHAHEFDDPCLGEHHCGKAAFLQRRFLAGLSPHDDFPADGGIGSREPASATDVLHVDLDIEILPATEEIYGSCVFTVKALSDGLSSFSVKLRSNYAITALLLDGVTSLSPASVIPSGSYNREIPLGRTYDADDEFTLRIDYNGVAVSRGFGSIEFGVNGAGDPLIASLSEPYYAATWWPAKDGDFGQPCDYADKFALDFAITAPSDLRSVSNGLLQGVDSLSGGRSRYRWRSDYPIATYLVAFSSSIYNTWTANYVHSGGTMPVEFNIFPGSDTPANRNAWELVVSALDVLGGVYGPYPFINEKYGIYQFGFGGGMEHQTNTGQGTFVDWVSVHELGHQWWGDNVTCRTWYDIWLNEGFATYTEALWYERRAGSTGLPALHSAMAARRPANVAGSVYVDDITNLNRIFDTSLSYRKGGWVLHMLRKVVGDETFFQILATYRASFEGSAATTADFAAVASAVAGKDLAWFFDEWIYGVGAPAYRVGGQTVAINGQNYLRLYVNQNQDASFGVFSMPIDVRVDRADGSETHTIWNDALTEHYVLPIQGPATGVALDEFNWVLATSKTNVSYVPGSPKVVATSPPPGAAILASAAPTEVLVTFSANVSSIASYYSISRDSAPLTPAFMYTPSSFTAKLLFAEPLQPGEYALTLSDAITSTSGGFQLDGDIADAWSPSSLPSGDGQAGGTMHIAFRVRPPCPADLSLNQTIDLSDLAVLLANYGSAGGVTPAMGDLDGDGSVGLSDLATLLAQFGADCP